MPKIPDYTQLKRDIPQVSGDIDVRGVGANVGAGLMDVAKVTAGIHERKNKNLLAKAESNMFTDLIAESNAYDQDPEYGTIDERFTGNIETKLGEHAATITDPALREQFIQTFRPKIAQSRVKVQDIAFGKERDFERGELTTSLETLRNAAVLSGGDDILGANDRAGALIQSHVDLGHVDADEAVKFKASFRDDVSKGYLETLEPEERVAALKQPWAKKNLAPDDYAVLRKAAENDLRLGRVQSIVQEGLDLDLDDKQMVEHVKKKAKTPLDLEAALARADKAIARRDRAELDERSEITSDLIDMQRGDKMPLEQYKLEKPDEWDKLSTSEKRAAYAADENRAKGKTIGYNAPADLLLSDEYRKNPDVAREWFNQNYGTLSDSQQKSWVDVFKKGMTPVLESRTSAVAFAKIRADSLDLDKQQKAGLLEDVYNWHSGLEKMPSQSDVNKFVDDRFEEVTVPDSGFFFDTEKMKFEVTQDEEVKFIRANHPDGYDATVEFLEANNLAVTPGRIKRAFEGGGFEADPAVAEKPVKEQAAPVVTVEPAQEAATLQQQAEAAEPKAAAITLPPMPAKAAREKAIKKEYKSLSKEEREIKIREMKEESPSLFDEVSSRYGGSPTTWQIFASLKEELEPLPDFSFSREYWRSLNSGQRDLLLQNAEVENKEAYDAAIEKYLDMGFSPTPWQLISAYSDIVGGEKWR